MAADRRLVVLVQPEVPVGRLEDPSFALMDSPVFAHDPVPGLVRMLVDGPSPQHLINNVVQLREDSCTDDVRVVLIPATDRGVQALNERGLLRVFMAGGGIAEMCSTVVCWCLGLGGIG